MPAIDPLGNDHAADDVQVAGVAAAIVRNASPADAEHVAWLGAGRDVESRRLVQRGRLDCATERGHGHGDIHGTLQVPAVASKHAVGPHVEKDVQIARRRARLAVLPFAPHPNAHIVAGAGLHLEGYIRSLANAAFAPAGGAWVGYDQASAVAAWAGGDGAEGAQEGALIPPDLAGAAAGGATAGLGSRLSAAAGARLAPFPAIERDGLLDAQGRFVEGEL